ncbi:MAG: cupin domain-containing protein [Micromonosporaceae bacterium]
MPLVRPSDAVRHQLHGAAFTSYAAPSLGSRELCAWRLDVPAGVVGVPHRIGREEVFLVLDGEPVITLDDEPHPLTPGDVLVAPAGVTLRLDTGERPVAAWVTTSVGFEGVLTDGTRITPPWVR